MRVKEQPMIANQSEAPDETLWKYSTVGREAQSAPADDNAVKTSKPAVQPERNERLLREHLHDPYILSTTDLHLPRRIADAGHQAYQGTLDQHYDDGGHLLRVNRVREE
jgi:hypothetical protein